MVAARRHVVCGHPLLQTGALRVKDGFDPEHRPSQRLDLGRLVILGLENGDIDSMLADNLVEDVG